MKILITGGSGFIGRNLREQLDSSYVIHAPASSELNLVDSEKVRDYLRTHSFDIIIHSATWNATRNSPKDLSLVLNYNLRMFFNIVRNKGRFNRMILLSSAEDFSRPHWIPGMKEEYFDTHVPGDD